MTLEQLPGVLARMRGEDVPDEEVDPVDAQFDGYQVVEGDADEDAWGQTGRD